MLCECGCGQRTRISNETDSSKGWIKGVPLKFIRFHNRRIYRKYSNYTDTPEYKTWWAMLDRCENPKNKSFPGYGGRGICVIGKMRSFDGFMSIMGQRPNKHFSIERIDNDGNYIVGNVKWATKSEQAKNQRRPKLTARLATQIRELKSNGIAAKDLSERFGISRRHVHHIAQGKYWQ